MIIQTCRAKKKEIINELIELYNLMHLYYLNKIDNKEIKKYIIKQ